MLQTEGKEPLPPTVVDQIKLWELERNRLIYTEGVLYSQFLSQVISVCNKKEPGFILVFLVGGFQCFERVCSFEWLFNMEQ